MITEGREAGDESVGAGHRGMRQTWARGGTGRVRLMYFVEYMFEATSPGQSLLAAIRTARRRLCCHGGLQVLCPARPGAARQRWPAGRLTPVRSCTL